MRRPAEILPCDRLELRRWQEKDIDALTEAIRDSYDHLLPWSRLAVGDSREVATGLVTTALSEWERDEAYKYAITVDGLVVGGCGLMRRVGPGGLEIGYWLRGDWTGRGLATEAVAALITAGFALDGVRWLEIRHDAANLASAAVPRRLGFEEVKLQTAPDAPYPLMPGESGVVMAWRKACPSA
ncbi:GNAT family N-acetyltransferase [Microtetraspora sp. AC03309]|uniref:GNAT family N-acetyltransferase n=1 Tax=Microtetraspora sp. AC03309 TaxID=2779376 RepID=UPI001E4C4290|nr:GNAT family N-acetyltransferase [Microtetraspora sp. AC03309]